MGTKKMPGRGRRSTTGSMDGQRAVLTRLARELNASDLVAVVPKRAHDADLASAPADLLDALSSFLVPLCRTVAALRADPRIRDFMEFRVLPKIAVVGWSAGGSAPHQRYIQAGFALDR